MPTPADTAKPDPIDAVPVAPDTEAARWEAAYCIEHRRYVALAADRSRMAVKLAAAARALSFYAGGKTDGGAHAAQGLEIIQRQEANDEH